MSADTSLIFQDELEPNESVLWSGQPKLGLVLRPSDAIQIPFSLLWSGVMVSMIVATIISGFPLLVLVLFIPFVLAAVYLTIGRFFVDALWRSKTYYALTNEMKLIL